MESQEESSSAIAPSLMASLAVAYNYLSLKAGKLVRLVRRYSSPALVAPDSVAAESAPVPKKRRLSLSLRKRLGRLAWDPIRRAAIAQVITWLRQTIVYIAHSSLLPQYYNFHRRENIARSATIRHLWNVL